MFKVGDVVVGSKHSDYPLTCQGSYSLVLEVGVGPALRVRIIDTPNEKHLKGNKIFLVEKYAFEYPPLTNSLNKKLYPNRIEWNGYLIPAKAAAKLNEEQY